MLKLSIIIPIYNVEKYIKDCLNSILSQKTNDFEVICIDDGSVDNSGKICDKYATLDSRIKVIHQKNKGVSFSRNLGISLSKGQYIAWIDPDDTISKEWFNEINKHLNENIDIVLFDYILVKNREKEYINYKRKSGYLENTSFLYDVLEDKKINSHLWRCVCKKILFNKIKFPDNTNIREDYAVLPYVIKKAKRIFYISKCLYFYRVREHSLSTEYDFDKAYKCYIIGKERYNNFSKLDFFKKKLPKDIYLLFALDCCLLYYKSSMDVRHTKKKEFEKCRQDIKNNKLELFKMYNVSIRVRIKYLFCILNILGPMYFIKKKIFDD